MTADKYLLYLDNIYKKYGDKVVLDNVDLAVKAGELITVVGPSGCGKSTLLRLILGQEQATSGQILIDGEIAGTPNPQRGIVYQKYSLFPHLSVLDNTLLGKRLQYGFFERRKHAAEFKEAAMFFLKRVGLDQHAHKYPHELSGGMQQRAAIAQALIMQHRILLMDEPFGALDPQTREDMQMFLEELWEQEKMTIFFVTHDMEEAILLGRRLFVLSQYYTDDRGHAHPERGAKIVYDCRSSNHIISRRSIREPAFIELIEEIRRQGFDPEHLQHASEFNLAHPDSFQTLTENELQM